jgi:5-methyltetrahydropteroyltriglutamate--homocysteine methyltransferase
MADSKPSEAFMTAASPGVLSKFVPDNYYKDEDAYIEAMANAMQTEYEAIHAAGLILQIDCPDFGSARHNQYKHLSDDEFLKIAWRNMEAVNAATTNIPPGDMRLHICWGNYEGPHCCDISMDKVFSTLMSTKSHYVLFETSNPRHAHEWTVFRDRASEIPDDKILVPGVVDTTTNFVEHPELVAERIARFVGIVGAERVIAGSDCGFGTFAGFGAVDPEIAYAKLTSLAEGAALASSRL